MNKRDLKEDLEKFEKINEIIPEPCGDFIRDVVAPHALKRAIAAEEEVERLKVVNRSQSRYTEEMQSRAHHYQVLSEKLQEQLHDADKFIRYTINNLLSAKTHEDFVDFDEIIKQGTLLYQAIQRIQGESEQNE